MKPKNFEMLYKKLKRENLQLKLKLKKYSEEINKLSTELRCAKDDIDILKD
jgi:hypothetical protein